MKVIVLKKNVELIKKITAALSVLLIFALFSTVYSPQKTLMTFKNVRLKSSVVLDAGHGGFDGGATSVFGEYV